MIIDLNIISIDLSRLLMFGAIFILRWSCLSCNIVFTKLNIVMWYYLYKVEYCLVILSLQSWILSCDIIFTKLNIVLWYCLYKVEYCLYKVWYIFWRGIVGETWAFRPPRLQLETFQTFFIFRQISPFPQSLSPLSLLSLYWRISREELSCCHKVH